MLAESAKQAIDGLSIDELDEEFTKGRYSRFANESYVYLTARRAKLKREEESKNIARNHELAEEANRISKEANTIAKESKSTAKLSYRMAVVAVIISLVAILVQWLQT